jgi:transketolase
MRAAFSDAIVRAAQADPRVLLLTGDHGYALFDAFRKACPDQYINCGIAEQNMVGVAAGLAKGGFRPIVYGLAAFVPMRVLEQIKIDVSYEQLPVVLVGDGAGVVYSHLGSSHQSTEDIAATRAVPHLQVYSPADRFELTASMAAALQSTGPSYMRMGKADLGDVHASVPPHVHKLQSVLDLGGDLIFVATGAGVSRAMAAAHELGRGQVLSVPCIKPFDAPALLEHMRGKRTLITVEEHSVQGGLAGVVAEHLLGRFVGNFVPVGVADRFSRKCGNYDYLLSEHGLTVSDLVRRVLSAEDAAANSCKPLA